MEVKKYVEKVIASDNQEKKDKLATMVCEMMKKLNEEDKEKYETKLYELSEGKVLNEEKAAMLINAMTPNGQKWTLEETNSVKAQFGYDDIRPVDFWIVMNSAWNDFYDLFKDNIEYYAKYSYDFIKDEDAVDDKVYYYFTMIPKN